MHKVSCPFGKVVWETDTQVFVFLGFVIRNRIFAGDIWGVVSDIGDNVIF